MTTTVVFAGTADGQIESDDATYATARAGASLSVSAASVAATVGQTFLAAKYFIYESFFGFDASAIADTDTISACALDLYGRTDLSTTDFTIQARTKDWGGTVDTGDWVAGADLGALTLLATFATSGWSTAGYNTFTENGTNLRDWVSKTAVSYLMINSSRHEAGTTPSGNEYLTAYAADQAGTTNDPKITVTHAGAATAPPPPRRIWRVWNRVAA